MKVTIQVTGPVKTGKTEMLKMLKTAAVAFAFGRGQEIEVTTSEVSVHKQNGLRPTPPMQSKGETA